MISSIAVEKKIHGININDCEIGFMYPKILDVVELYKKNNIPISGGDVYIKKDGVYHPTYDNWYVNKEEKDYLNISIEHTLNYINSYKNKENVVFVLVPNWKLMRILYTLYITFLLHPEMQKFYLIYE